LHHLQGILTVVDTRGELSISTFAFQSVAFRAPSWAPDGKRIAYVDRLNGVDSLLIANLDDGTPLRVAPINNLGVFLWSPVANEIAFTQISTSTNLGTPTYDGLVVFDADALETRLISTLEIAAFFWSPDGSKLAYVTIDRATATISWYVNDRLGNAERKLADFVPSREQLFTMFSFFDQYAYSNSLWSPDSRSLVYAGRELSSNGSGADTIFVLPVDGSAPARAIAPGSLAFWSPR
jgi:TolB protein